jgi:hypothetical protein
VAVRKTLIERLSPLLQTEADQPIACHYKLIHLSQVIHVLDLGRRCLDGSAQSNLTRTNAIRQGVAADIGWRETFIPG